MANYLRLLAFLKGHRGVFSLAVVTMFFSALMEKISWSIFIPLMDRILTGKNIVVPNELPAFLMNLIDFLNRQDPHRLFWMLPVVLVITMSLKHAFIYLHQYLMNDVAQRVLQDIRFRLFEKIQHLSLDYFSQRRTGELMSRITHDVSIVENAVAHGVSDLFKQSFAILLSVAIAFLIHYKAAIVIFIVLPFIGWPISRIGTKLRKLSRSIQERMADISSILLENISGIKVVKAFCKEDDEIEKFKKLNRDFYKLKMKATKRTLLISPITELFGVVCGIIMVLWLGRQVMEGELSLGVFMFFFGSIMSMISPIKALGNVNALTQQALAANERIYAVLDLDPTIQEKSDAVDIPEVREKIVLENVTFQYDETGGPVLKDINLEINVGELVAIVGPTGTGKSTLVNLIPRFYEPQKGRVVFDGVDIKDATFPSIRGQIGIVMQETFLFNDTVKANIAYGHPEASQAEVEEAARKAYAHQFIVEMPNKYETTIGDRGFRLSGGEKQRVAIARAILKNPPVLILDEATSQLDSESEKFVQDALDHLMEGRTVIAIAHRLSTIKKADKIVVLEKGRIVGMGRHEELLKTCELYQRLYETQFQM